MATPGPSGGFGPYWGYGWGTAYSPGYLTTDTIVSVETLVYSLTDDKLLWASSSRTTNPGNLDQLIREVADATAKEMAKQGCPEVSERAPVAGPAEPARVGRASSVSFCLALCGLCVASTPESWGAFDEEVLRACIAASSLHQVRAAGERVDFDDRLGYSALLLFGRYPQAHMQTKPGRELCLFDRRTRTAAVSDADRLVRSKKPVEAPAAVPWSSTANWRRGQRRSTRQRWHRFRKRRPQPPLRRGSPRLTSHRLAAVRRSWR